MILTTSTQNTSKSLLALSRHTNRAISHGFNYLIANSKNPLVVALGSVEVFAETDVPVARIVDVSKLLEDSRELQSLIKSNKYDGVMVDSLTLLRRLMIADVSGGERQLSIQEYGIINNCIASFVLPLRHAVPVFVTSAAFVLNDEKSKSAKSEVWEHDLTSNLRATLFPQFDYIHYIGYNASQGEQVQEDRDLAIDGSFPRVVPTIPTRKK